MHLEGAYSIQSFSFQPSWYAVTAEETVPADCLEINQDGLTFTAGLSLSNTVQKAFMGHQTEANVLGEHPGIPSRLYFTLEGAATFTFNRSAELFWSSKVIRLGTGFSIRGGKNWWLGNLFCGHREVACSKCKEPLKDLKGLVCGDLFFAFGGFAAGGGMQFYVAPLAWVQ